MPDTAPELEEMSEDDMAARIISDYERALYHVQHGHADDALEIYRWIGMKRVHEGWVYFAQCERFIKVGHSVKPIERAAALNTSLPMPVRFLGTQQGGRDLERALHRRFGKSRVRYEWFRPSKALCQYITRHASLLAPTEAIG